MVTEDTPQPKNTLVLPQVVDVGGEYQLDGKPCFELPPGSHRPEQMLISQLLRKVFPVASVGAATVQGETGEARFFSLFEDVTAPEFPARKRSTVQAEYVLLREIFLCKDRSFRSKENYHYPRRRGTVQGHNMDWVPTEDSSLIKAIHYDFEDFYGFLKWMEELWVTPLPIEKQQQLAALYRERLQGYAQEFGSNEFALELKILLDALSRTLTRDRVTSIIEATVSQQQLPDVDILVPAIRNKIVFFMRVLEGFIQTAQHKD